MDILFISQEVEEALQVCGIPTEDFAGFVKTPIYEENEQGEVLTEKEPLDFSYALRYGEFISLNTYMIQKLMIQVSNLEKRVEELEKERQT